LIDYDYNSDDEVFDDDSDINDESAGG